MPTPVSVVIAAYNAERTLATAIRSAIREAPDEIIVVDDGSRDNTSEVAQALGVQVVSVPNGGPGRARNIGIEAARNEWIALLDADDWWLANKLQAQMQLIADDVAVVATLSDIPGSGCPPELNFAALWEQNTLVTSSVMLRRSAWDRIGGFDEHRPMVEDYDLWLRIAATGMSIRCVQQILTHYTLGGGLSDDRRQRLDGLLAILDKAEYSLPVSSAAVAAKRDSVLDYAIRSAMIAADLRTVRHAGWRVLRERPSLNRAAMLGMACLPAGLRGIAQRLRGETS